MELILTEWQQRLRNAAREFTGLGQAYRGQMNAANSQTNANQLWQEWVS